jgi:hypothetical protein
VGSAHDDNNKSVGEKIQDTWIDATDRIGDKFDEMKADGEVKKAEGEVKKAEAEREAVKERNEIKEDVRDKM